LRYHFCPKCGGKLMPQENRNQPVCCQCKFIFYQNPIVGVAAIVIKERQILLGKRNTSFQDTWCIPCGYVEYEEDVRAAAAREFLEETGLVVTIGPVYDVHSNFHNPLQHTVGVWFFANIVGGVLQANDDLSEVEFFSFEHLPTLAFNTDRLVLNRLKREGYL